MIRNLVFLFSFGSCTSCSLFLRELPLLYAASLNFIQHGRDIRCPDSSERYLNCSLSYIHLFHPQTSLFSWKPWIFSSSISTLYRSLHFLSLRSCSCWSLLCNFSLLWDYLSQDQLIQKQVSALYKLLMEYSWWLCKQCSYSKEHLGCNVSCSCIQSREDSMNQKDFY